MGMNFYLLFFTLYGLMILPVNLHSRLRLGQNTGYWVRLEAVGLPLSGTKEKKNLAEEEADEAKGHALSDLNFQLIRTLTEKKTFRRLMELGQLNRLNLFARLSFQDAAQTALLFGLSRVVLDTLHKTKALPACFRYRIQGDFSHAGSILLLDGILSARTGKLLATFILLGISYRRRKLLSAPAQPSA
jgi:hypothetical protein